MPRLAFIKLVVDDLPRMLAFYETLGFTSTNRFENAEMEEILLKQDGADFLFCLMRIKAGKPAGAVATVGTIGFVTDDIGAAVDQAIDSGATLAHAVFEIQGTQIALVRDPEGNEIEFVEFTDTGAASVTPP